MTTNIYHATPYDISATGFYFSSIDEYRDKADRHCNAYGQPVEEFEIQFIDGDNHHLFKALDVNQANLKQWFDDFEELEDKGAVKAIYLAEDQHQGMEEILDYMDDVYLYEGSAEEYAEQYLEDTGALDGLAENLRNYFGVEAFARDFILSGDITEIEVAGVNYVIQYS